MGITVSDDTVKKDDIKTRTENLEDADRLQRKLIALQDKAKILPDDSPLVKYEKAREQRRIYQELEFITCYNAYSNLDMPFSMWIKEYIKDLIEDD